MTDLKKSLTEHFESQDDILVTVQATKGTAYAMFLSAMASTLNVIRTTNGMICEKFPPEMVELVHTMQISRMSAMIEPFFYDKFPGNDAAIVKQRHAACDEFQKNIEVLVKQRMALEKLVGSQILGG